MPRQTAKQTRLFHTFYRVAFFGKALKVRHYPPTHI